MVYLIRERTSTGRLGSMAPIAGVQERRSIFTPPPPQKHERPPRCDRSAQWVQGELQRARRRKNNKTEHTQGGKRQKKTITIKKIKKWSRRLLENLCRAADWRNGGDGRRTRQQLHPLCLRCTRSGVQPLGGGRRMLSSACLPPITESSPSSEGLWRRNACHKYIAFFFW